jgi:putative CocE/NonD family hydrolase
VVLYADVYRPLQPGRYPVLVGRTPYSTERHATPVYQYPHAYEAPLFFSRRGYVFVYQDTRGRHESEGIWEPFRDDINDGYDTIEWAASQPWSNGKVGMHGVSYEGTVQWRAAMAAPPHLVTIVPSVASTSIYHDWVTQNGAWRLSFNFDWGAIRQESRITQNTGPHYVAGGPEAISLAKVLWHLPLNDMQRLVGRKARFYQDWLAHPDYDDYWRKIDAEEVFDQIGIPVLNFGGWFDLFRQGTLRGYIGPHTKGKTAAARQKTQLLIGPWGHWPSSKTGALDFGEAAMVDQNTVALEWFDYWLKGLRSEIADRPPVRLFVMGANRWRYEDEYPLARSVYRPMYFASGGKANSVRGDGRLSWEAPAGGAGADKYTYDPNDPVHSQGLATDQRSIENRSDVLVYTSAILNEDLEVTGPVQVVLYASSDAPDTDFVGRLIDVYPDGRPIAMASGILRARYRDSCSRPAFLTPGKLGRLPIDLVGTSNVFRKGHRVRVDITSSDFPAFDRNLNTDKPFGTSAQTRVAHQTVFHGTGAPSHVLLPVVPARH